MENLEVGTRGGTSVALTSTWLERWIMARVVRGAGFWGVNFTYLQRVISHTQVQSFKVLLRTFWDRFWYSVHILFFLFEQDIYCNWLAACIHSRYIIWWICILFQLYMKMLHDQFRSASDISDSLGLQEWGIPKWINLVTLFTWAANTKSWLFGLGDSTILLWIRNFCSFFMRIPKQPVYWDGIMRFRAFCGSLSVKVGDDGLVGFTLFVAALAVRSTVLRWFSWKHDPLHQKRLFC